MSSHRKNQQIENISEDKTYHYQNKITNNATNLIFNSR